ncbi:MAG: hypothetical protein EHM45_14780 [Desulfobacteraceae bacterium]|nr:MAG: hypothetical protein EHM45_14780 [Desulfobacteraceae bacterium]
MPKLVVHIGLHKTGSTWLQTCYFPTHPEIHYLNRIDKEMDVFHYVMKADENQWNIQHATGLVERTLKNTNGKINLYSEENLSGQLWRGCFDSKRIALRMSQVFKGLKIILIVRNQIDMLKSIYRQYVHEGGYLSFKGFLDDEKIAGKDLLEHLKYATIIEYYMQLFGQENIYLGIYEEFERYPDTFVEELSAFMGVKKIYFDKDFHDRKINRSYSPLSLLLARGFNRIQKTKFNPNGLLPDPSEKLFNKRYWLQNVMDKYIYYKLFAYSPIRLPNEEKIKNDYRPGNRRLCKLAGKDLTIYQYPV